MEDDVDVAGQLVHQLAVADVALDQPDRAVGERPGEVLPPAADEVVEHHHLPHPCPDELVGDVRAHGAPSAGDQSALTVHVRDTHAPSTGRHPSFFRGLPKRGCVKAPAHLPPAPPPMREAPRIPR